ncbi:4Fe-4S binding protein [Methanospirillum hungatei]|uniref:4Fe-4S binding protein n=1 Tax=Methanospirillum hungatei TaxID=2203 RepID=UPI0026EED4B0|nr:4Fe-4S binding protein [Methanospirillum hungatei]MCA1914999.1 4Fe-4S binding protein [Methanospirillum hungatei]
MIIRDLIIRTCTDMGISCVGCADVSRWEQPLFSPWVPESFYPTSIYPEARTAVVIGLPVHLPVVETAPSIWYREEYKVVNSLLDQNTWRLATLLNDQGFPSVSIPRDGYGSINVLQKNPVAFFSHRHAAVLAGLGTFGRNNMVLTRAWGPRVRFGTVLTTARIDSDPLIETSLCTRCNACIRACPVQALEEEDYPESTTNKKACAYRSAALNAEYRSPCGVCIKVCPVGADREFYDRPDIRIYEENGSWNRYHKAWAHVRSYGSDTKAHSDEREF